MRDAVNHPSHYTQGGVEVLDVILAYDLDFLTGNVLKYVCRSKFKGREREDLEKALFYLKKKLELVKER